MFIAVLAAMTLLFHEWSVRRGAGSRPAIVPPDSLARLDVATGYRRGVKLAAEGRYSSALPYFRRTNALRSNRWETHLNLGSTLFNTSVESRTHRGVRSPMTRSSWERIAAVREALERFESAERLAPGLHERAEVADRRARRFALWGLSWDAYSNARAAMEWDPTVHAGDPILRAVARPDER